MTDSSKTTFVAEYDGTTGIFVSTTGQFSAVPLGCTKARTNITLSGLKSMLKEQAEEKKARKRKDANVTVRLFDPRTGKADVKATYIGVRLRDGDVFSRGHNFKVNDKVVDENQLVVIPASVTEKGVADLEAAHAAMKAAKEAYADAKNESTREFDSAFFYSSDGAAEATARQNEMVRVLGKAARYVRPTLNVKA